MCAHKRILNRLLAGRQFGRFCARRRQLIGKPLVFRSEHLNLSFKSFGASAKLGSQGVDLGGLVSPESPSQRVHALNLPRSGGGWNLPFDLLFHTRTVVLRGPVVGR